MEAAPEAVEAALDDARAKLLVHGHTHRRHHDHGARRIVLGDWDHCGRKLALRAATRRLRVLRSQTAGR